MFRSIVTGWLERPIVVATFLESTKDGELRIEELEKQLDFKAAKPSPPIRAGSAGPDQETDLSNVVELITS